MMQETLIRPRPQAGTVSRPSLIRRFAGDTRGAMSVEFMLVMPMLLFALVGGVGFYATFQSFNETAKVAYVVNDIVSRYEDVDTPQMVELMDLQQKMLPTRIKERSLRITSICFAGGSYKVLWSWSSHTVDTSPLPQLSTGEIPLDMMPTLEEQESVILTETRGTWQPLLRAFGVFDQQWYNVLAVRPRFVQIIPHATLNPATVCPSA